ncbi:ACT domain-containing protein [Flavobacterium hercynium]|uniref:Acetyltransferase n=1 Tax=Flavobacterium hercynium TaxID=387094 RepID=A0A226H7I4_9FLAO|nr:ACT domain-containing protein [Flavobacterium hercynium]OXA90044.1 acetyltransferase [Flavobacterium hercynium]SMP14548.1 hypothetical protein SAMN06265346_104117 [Flavobacterium hercynium]
MNTGEKDLNILLKSMKPILNDGEYVFYSTKDTDEIKSSDIISLFHEKEGISLILAKETADNLKLNYNYVASWITLEIHSSLEAVGLTAAFSKALSEENISCNVVAAFYHDHIFVAKEDAEKAMTILLAFLK